MPGLAMPTDARLVSDLPESSITNSLKVSDLFYGRSQTCKGGGCFRQVKDLPRIRAAKPRSKSTDLSMVTPSRFFFS